MLLFFWNKKKLKKLYLNFFSSYDSNTIEKRSN